MWPHWPHDLWCHVCWSGIFFVHPYFVVTGTQGSGTRGTIHSPFASSSSTFSRMSSAGSGAVRVNARPLGAGADWTTGRLMGMGLSSGGRVAGLLELLFHDVLEDHVEPLVDLLDHVHDAGHVPDEVELGERLVGHVPRHPH